MENCLIFKHNSSSINLTKTSIPHDSDNYIRSIIDNNDEPPDPENRTKYLDQIIAYLESGAQLAVNERGENGETLAHVAARLHLPELTQYLIENNTEIIECCDKSGIYPWHVAAQSGCVEILRLHHVAGHDLTSRWAKTQWSVLHIAALSNQTDVIKYILDNNIQPVDHFEIFNRTPLFMAIQYQKKEATYILLKYGADQTLKTKLKMTSTGLSAYFMPELTVPLLSEINELTDSNNRDAAFFLKHFQSKDLDVLLVAPNSNNVIVQPIIQDLIKQLYFHNQLVSAFFCVRFFLDLSTISFICMTEINDFWRLKEEMQETHFTELVCVSISLIWISITCIYKIVKLMCLTRLSYESNMNDASGMLTSCSKKCTDKRFNLRTDKFKSFHKHLRCIKTTQLFGELYWVILGTLAKLAVLVLWLVKIDEYENEKHYIIFVATIVIFYDAIFNDTSDLFFVPDFFMITILSIKRCLREFVRILFAIVMFGIPYILIAVKFTYKENHYFTNYDLNESIPQNGTDLSLAIGLGTLYLFKAMLSDDYEVEYFNKNHQEFFLVYHVLFVFLYSLVIMNLIIAQTSMLYESFVENSKAEILKDRIFTLMLFGMFGRAEDKNEKQLKKSATSTTDL